MSRRNAASKRDIAPDHKYNSKDITKFICCIMRDGKKSVAEKIVYNALEKIDSNGKKGIETFDRALANVMPKVEVVSKRVGGATFMMPVEVSETKSKAMAMRWIKEAAQARGSFDMATKLSQELVDAAGEVNDEGQTEGGRGGAIKKRDQVYSMAEANKAFANFNR